MRELIFLYYDCNFLFLYRFFINKCCSYFSHPYINLVSPTKSFFSMSNFNRIHRNNIPVIFADTTFYFSFVKVLETEQRVFLMKVIRDVEYDPFRIGNFAIISPFRQTLRIGNDSQYTIEFNI